MSLAARDPVAQLPTLGFVSASDAIRADSWSGIPAALATALGDLGVGVVAIHGRLPRRVERGLRAWTYLRWRLAGDAWLPATPQGRAPTRARTGAARMRMRGAALDGVVVIGSDLLVPASVPTATFEDKTIVQEVRRGDAGWLAVPEPDRSWRIARQRQVYEAASVCCTLSNWAARSIRDDYGIAPEKIRVIGAGATHRAAPEPRDWRQPRFLFVGRDWARKNGPAVVSAFLEVRRRVPSAELHLVGSHPPICEPGIFTYGPQDLGQPQSPDLIGRLLAAATCFVMPSHHEPLGIAYLEAGAAGLPSIASTRDGAPEAVGPGGRLVDPERRDELVGAMLELARPEVAQRLGAEARRHAAAYTWQLVAERLMVALGLPAGGADPHVGFLNDEDLA